MVGCLHPLSQLFGAPGLACSSKEKKGQKAGVHVGTMTQHLSRLQPGAAWPPGRARSSLPNMSFIFRFLSRAPGWARLGPKAGAARPAVHYCGG